VRRRQSAPTAVNDRAAAFPFAPRAP